MPMKSEAEIRDLLREHDALLEAGKMGLIEGWHESGGRTLSLTIAGVLQWVLGETGGRSFPRIAEIGVSIDNLEEQVAMIKAHQ